MNTAYKSLGIVRPAPDISAVRRPVSWSEMTNENLKFTFDLLALHQSPYEVEAMSEIERRRCLGRWLDLDAPPPPLHNVPALFYIWPFSLLWRQCPEKE